MSNTTQAVWRKASRSQWNGGCVEIAASGSRILLRDTADPSTQLDIRKLDLECLIDGMKKGEFDDLIN